MVLVSGLPRSGTSMMMQMLAAGGLPVLSDGVRRADDDNPRGYYELEAVKQTKQDAAWLAQAPGHAVKMISQLLFDLPADRVYHVIFMRREMEEILASQRRMLARRKGQTQAGPPDEEMRRVFTHHLEQVSGWMAQAEHLRCLEVWHGQVLAQPQDSTRRLADFLGLDLDLDAMAQVVDRSLHRQKAAAGVGAADFMAADEEEAVAQRLRELGYL